MTTLKVHNLMDLNICIHPRNHLHSQDNEQLFHLQKFLHTPFQSLPAPLPHLPQTIIPRLTSIFCRILYKQNYIVCIFRAGRDWILSLSIIILRFIPICCGYHSSFLSVTKWCYIEWIYDNLFSHSPVDRHMNCLKFLVTMNKAALSMHGQIVV